jgi:hypothetical protein
MTTYSPTTCSRYWRTIFDHNDASVRPPFGAAVSLQLIFNLHDVADNVVLGKSVNRLNGIPSGLSDSIGQVAHAQRAYLAQIGIRLSFRRRRSQYNNVKLARHTRSPLWTLKCSNADYHCAVFVEQKLQDAVISG